ncbi:glutathione S-transferase family protein [bacterium]|nr:glutathione S-transferase family protein [bacterium]
MLKLLGAYGSPFVRKVKVVLDEKGLKYEHEQVVPFPATPEFRKVSPLGKIPAFVDGDKALADSSIICAYLEKTHPSPALYPSDPYEYARALWFEEYGDSGLAPIIGGKMFFNRIIGPRIMKKPFDDALYQQAVEKDLPPMFDYLENQIAGDYLAGGMFSIADLAIATQFVNYRFAGGALDASRWPKLTAYLERTHARPKFAAAIAIEEKIFGGRRD